MRLLLLSNSTMPGEPYLGYPGREIGNFLGKKPVTALFIPYAAVTFSFDMYESKVEKRFSEIGHHIKGIHRFSDPVKAVEQAEAIIVGGGNTWQLARTIHENSIMDIIRKKVLAGAPYIGWSAGSNIACPTLKTTNDMPIVDPLSFKCMSLVPFQINPHYIDYNPKNHGGETREQRIEEFIEANHKTYVAGLREGTMFHYENGRLRLKGERKVRIFMKGTTPVELTSNDNFDFLMTEGRKE